MDVLNVGKYDKKALLVSVFLLIAIPFSVFLALQRQELRSYAQTSGWKIYNRNPIIFPGGGSEDNNIYAPDVHKEGSVWKMWYGGQGEDGHDRIHYAVSTDGINWQKKGVVLDNGKARHVNDPSVVLVNGIYYMYYTDYTDGIGDRIHLATSTDGVNWQKKGLVIDVVPNSWETQHTARPSVIYENNQFKMWYDATGPTGRHVGYATSTDGYKWQKSSSNPVFLNAGAVDVKHVGNSYIMLRESGNGTYWASGDSETSFKDQGLLFGKTGNSADAYGHVAPMIYVENGVWTRVYFGGASHSCWCQNRIFMAQPLTLCTADQAADNNVADGIDKRYCTINEHPSGKIIKSSVETVNRSCSSPPSYWEASDCYNASDDSILYGEKKVYIDDIKKYSIKLRVAIDDYLDWIEINGNKINRSEISQKCCSDYNNWMVVTDKFLTGWNVVKFKAVEGCGMDSWGGCGGRLVDLDFSVTGITPSPTPTPIPTPTVSGDCSGCTGGISCDEACRNAGYGSRGVCAVPGSTDPGRCCACFN